MRRIVDNLHRYTLERVLFPKALIEDSNCSLIRYMRFSEKKKITGAIEDIAYTFITDLQENAAEIAAHFTKNTRYEIRRAKKETDKIYFYTSEEIMHSPELVSAVRTAYDQFCTRLGNEKLKDVFDENRIKLYIEKDSLFISKAIFPAGGAVYHVYFHDEENAVLWYSASDFRNDNIDRSAAARCNKLLHYEDMLAMKKLGIKGYDWGNVSSKNNSNPNGIDLFKASFGGEYREVYSYTVGNDFPGKLLVLGKKGLDYLFPPKGLL